MLSCPLLLLFGSSFIKDLSSDTVMGVRNRLWLFISIFLI